MAESDEALMQQVGAGSHEAYRALVTRHLGSIVAFAGRTLGDRAGAEDVAQEVLVRLWTHARGWRPGKARLTTWLHRVAFNLCLDRLRRRSERALEGTSEPIDPKPSMTTVLHREDIGRYVNRELSALPEKQQIAIVLCHYQGLSNIEAADVMGVSVEALESLLARGRRTLRSRLRHVAPHLLGDT